LLPRAALSTLIASHFQPCFPSLGSSLGCLHRVESLHTNVI
jgi:hypothetical protein